MIMIIMIIMVNIIIMIIMMMMITIIMILTIILSMLSLLRVPRLWPVLHERVDGRPRQRDMSTAPKNDQIIIIRSYGDPSTYIYIYI